MDHTTEKRQVLVQLDMPWSTYAKVSNSFMLTNNSDMAYIPIELKTHYTLGQGERLGMLGNIPSLGLWDTTLVQPASPVPDQPGYWLNSFELPSERLVELKWLVFGQDGAVVRWEEGANHIIVGPNYCLPKTPEKVSDACQETGEHTDDCDTKSVESNEDLSSDEEQINNDAAPPVQTSPRLATVLPTPVPSAVPQEPEKDEKDGNQRKRHGVLCSLRSSLRRSFSRVSRKAT